jgi:hypothetical protein
MPKPDENAPDAKATPEANDTPAEAEVFEGVEEKPGRVRVDRPLTGPEAREQDRRHRQHNAAEVAAKFAGRTT